MTPSRNRISVPQTAEILSLLIALALVLAIIILTYQNWAAYRIGADRILVTRQLVDAESAELSALRNAEASERGFLLTGRESYLAPYYAALLEIPKDFNELDQLAKAYPEQARRVATLRPLVREKLDELARTIRVRRTDGAAAALTMMMNGNGDEVTDRIRRTCSAVEAEEYALLSIRRDAARAAAKRAGIISIGGSLILFALLTLSMVTIHRGTRRRQQLISALQDSEEQIRRGRDLLQTTLRSIGEGVIATDEGGRITFLNSVAQSLTGWTQEEAEGIPLEQVFRITNEKTGAALENPVGQALRDKRVLGFANNISLTSKRGLTTPIDDTAAPILNSHGEVIGGVLIFRSVGQRRQAERLEAALNERYRFFAEASKQLSSSLDYEQTLQRIARLAVPAFADYCVVDLLDEGIVHPVAYAHIDPAKETRLAEKRRRFPIRMQQQHPVAEVLRSGEARLIPETLDQALVAAAENDEHLAILRSFVPRSSIVVPLKARDKMLGTITFATGQTESGRTYDEPDMAWATEIAQRAALALDNARLYHQAQQARQAAESSHEALARINAELQQFTYATSHDLREPLRTINIYSQLLARQNAGKLDERSKGFLELILAGAMRMDQLINALLDYSKAGEVTNEPLVPVDMEAVLADTLAILGRTVIEAGAIVTHDPLPPISGSELHITQLLQNLISNAVKYRRREPPRVHISATKPDGEWLFKVSDNGEGIPRDQFSNIFAVFTRLHGHDYPGTGIGLATCRKIVERYGGRIWVESEVGKGSDFFFTLPG